MVPTSSLHWKTERTTREICDIRALCVKGLFGMQMASGPMVNRLSKPGRSQTTSGADRGAGLISPVYLEG